MSAFCKTVLLVDDNEIDNLVNGRLLKLSNFADEVVTKVLADEALEFLRNEYKITKTVPDFILLDIKMPESDGFDFLESFETFHENLKKKTKIYMLTSSIDKEDEARALGNKNVKNFISKPLTIEVLEKIKEGTF